MIMQILQKYILLGLFRFAGSVKYTLSFKKRPQPEDDEDKDKDSSASQISENSQILSSVCLALLTFSLTPLCSKL